VLIGRLSMLKAECAGKTMTNSNMASAFLKIMKNLFSESVSAEEKTFLHVDPKGLKEKVPDRADEGWI
jgi:hypothetical protein